MKRERQARAALLAAMCSTTLLAAAESPDGVSAAATATAPSTVTAETSHVAVATSRATIAPMTLWWRDPAADTVAWRGMLPTEGGAVGMGPQIGPYIVPGPAGLLAAVFAHGAIMQGAQSLQRQREQEAADRVLEPYAAVLQSWPSPALWDAAAASSASGGAIRRFGGAPDAAAGAADMQIDAVPVFVLAQDEAAVVLDVAVKLTPASGMPAVETLVRVVSSPMPGTDMRNMWLADNGRRLKTTAAAMLGHALQLAQRHGTTTADDAPARTHRYLQGGLERAERAQRLGGSCGRTVLRTLRGQVLSVPVHAQDGCAPDTAF